VKKGEADYSSSLKLSPLLFIIWTGVGDGGVVMD